MRTGVFSQGLDAELEGAAVLAHEMPVQQVRVRACQAGQHLHHAACSILALLVKLIADQHLDCEQMMCLITMPSTTATRRFTRHSHASARQPAGDF